MKNKITAAVFVIMLAAFAALFALGKGNVTGENREAAKMPALSAKSVFSGSFARDFSAFVDDKIALRSFFTSLNKELNSKKGIKTPAGRLVVTDSDIGTGEEKKSEFLIVNNQVFELFSKDTHLADEYADAINHYAKNLDPSINLYFALIPTAVEFQDAIYSNLQDSQKEIIDYVNSRLDSRVKTVDMYSSIQNHKDEYVYFRTDHHWTQLGAYYGYEALCSAADISAADKNSFPKEDISSFLGSLYTQTAAEELQNSPDTLEWYDTTYDNCIDIFMRNYDGGIMTYNSPVFDKNEDDYRFFLSGDNPLVCLTNKNNPEGKTLVIIRDSFANAFAPWVIRSYSRVILVDPRSAGLDFNNILNEFQPDDVLIMNYVFSTAFNGYSALLSNLYRAP